MYDQHIGIYVKIAKLISFETYNTMNNWKRSVINWYNISEFHQIDNY